MTVFAPRAKKDRGKNSPCTLFAIEYDQIFQNYEENSLSYDDESKVSNYDIVLN